MNLEIVKRIKVSKVWKIKYCVLLNAWVVLAEDTCTKLLYKNTSFKTGVRKHKWMMF